MSSKPPAPSPPPSIATDARGVARLAIDGVKGVTGIVESMHQRIAGGAPVLGQVEDKRTRGITGFVYRSIRGTTSLVGGALDIALSGVEKLIGDKLPAGPSTQRDAVVAAINGICGDHLERTGNPLAVPMHLRFDDTAERKPHVLLMVHGLCMTGSQWNHQGHDHGVALAPALGATPVYASYNSGRAIEANGAELATQIGALVSTWPVPVQSITIVGHSMGGLVARSAIEHAATQCMPWLQKLNALAFLGTPHHGAPLEQGGNWVHKALGVSPYLAPFARISGLRSTGITDLRHGSARPLPAGIPCFAVAGSLGPSLLGDGLVTVASAFGRHPDVAMDLGLAADRTLLVEGAGHLDLLSRPEVMGQLIAWLARPKASLL
jgi:pimeloyl-ACP methyl ester carboxylesterase